MKFAECEDLRHQAVLWPMGFEDLDTPENYQDRAIQCMKHYEHMHSDQNLVLAKEHTSDVVVPLSRKDIR